MPPKESILKTPIPGGLLLLANCLLCGFFVSASLAQTPEAPAVHVVEAAIAAEIENLTPINPGTVFESDVGKLYCYTRIHTDTPPVQVKHLWFQGDRFVMEIKLPVKSQNWRTFSSKTIHPSSIGDWKVTVTTEDGTVLETLRFTIQ